ncbi:MAG: phosphatase PAP2 family protein [Candidatus Doudnabacteria bacterium]|nr:phosphatase PAP2 family protein [Candidatus Doudnabacteria bacterium]
MKISESAYSAWQAKLQGMSWFGFIWKFWGMYGIVYYLAVGVFLLVRPESRILAATAFLAFVLARGVVAEILYLFIKTQRPHQIYNFSQPKSWLFSWGTKRPDSFPSGHAISSAAISSVLFFYNPVLGIVGFGVALFVGMGRIILGYHYVSDVLGGWFLGALTGYVAYFYLAEMLFTRF